jgi:hypothetical protein
MKRQLCHAEPYNCLLSMCSRSNTLGWNAVTCCACTIMRLFSVVFCTVGAMPEFDCSVVINEMALRNVVTETDVWWQNLCQSIVASCEGTLPTLCSSTAFFWVKVCARFCSSFTEKVNCRQASVQVCGSLEHRNHWFKSESEKVFDGVSWCSGIVCR